MVMTSRSSSFSLGKIIRAPVWSRTCWILAPWRPIKNLWCSGFALMVAEDEFNCLSVLISVSIFEAFSTSSFGPLMVTFFWEIKIIISRKINCNAEQVQYLKKVKRIRTSQNGFKWSNQITDHEKCIDLLWYQTSFLWKSKVWKRFINWLGKFYQFTKLVVT